VRDFEATSQGRVFGDAYMSGYYGLIYGDRGDFDAAFRHLDDALDTARKMEEIPVVGSVLTQVGIVQAQRGDWEGTFDTARQLRSLSKAVESTYMLAMSETLEGYASFYLTRDADPSIALLESGARTLATQGLKLCISFNYACLAEVLATAGHFERAATIAQRALDPSQVGDRMGDVMSHRALAIAAVRCDAPDAAASEISLARAEAAEARAGLPREAALNRYWRVVLDHDLGRRTEARAGVGEAALALKEVGLEWYVAQLETRFETP
jgi:tetratricopeptide (TPR) repeat protein